jgi:hypothetical protein
MSIIWDLITGLIPNVWPYIAGALALVGGWFVAKRQGAQGQKAKQAEAQAKANQKTIEEVLRETPSDDPADDIRDRMRKRARKP